jgi:hypothetical protein
MDEDRIQCGVEKRLLANGYDFALIAESAAGYIIEMACHELAAASDSWHFELCNAIFIIPGSSVQVCV